MAVTMTCPIGVDIERMGDIPEIEQIARQFFIPNETRKLMALPEDSRIQAFYACWTRKEAFLKATGEGIAESLAKVEVSLAPDEEPRVVALSGHLASNEPWHLHSFSPSRGYLGCVAYKNTPLTLSLWSVAKSSVWNYQTQ
jgi:4'-phosphopantetheinyl transferase